jgi:hypothetical protein
VHDVFKFGAKGDGTTDEALLLPAAIGQIGILFSLERATPTLLVASLHRSQIFREFVSDAGSDSFIPPMNH